jgi:hypothetical protein
VVEQSRGSRLGSGNSSSEFLLRCGATYLSWSVSPVHQLMVRSIASSSASPLGVAPFYLGGVWLEGLKISL